jgi:hypothetical protein
MTITAPLTHANGATHPQPPPSVPLLPRGPACPWPSGDVTPDTGTLTAVAASAVSRFLSRLRVPDGDTVITWAMAAAVALVAVDAAIVSYSHIYGLATGHWGSGAETGIQARLLPLSIDGVIFEASLVKLYGARHKTVRGPRRRFRMPGLATFMLWLGIVATVAANVTHGLPSSLLSPVAHMVIMALLSAWPAGALIGSVEMAMGLVRDKHAVASARGGDAGDEDSDKTAADEEDARRAARSVAAPPASRKPRRAAVKPGPRSATPPGTSDPVVAAIRDHDAWKAGRRLTRDDKDEIAKTAGVSRRSVERCLADARRMGPQNP